MKWQYVPLFPNVFLYHFGRAARSFPHCIFVSLMGLSVPPLYLCNSLRMYEHVEPGQPPVVLMLHYRTREELMQVTCDV